MSARETAVYWVEYVIRHRGASHLQYPGVYLNFWQSNSIDVIALLVVSVYVIFKVFMILLKLIGSNIFKPKSKVDKIKKRN
jgi:glucuronosyltransferase